MTTKKKLTSTACSTQKRTKTPYAGMRGVTRIHVNMHNIRANLKKGTDLPVITVKKGKQNVYGHEVLVDGPSAVVYSPGKPLSCGARVWIETVSTVRVTERGSNGVANKMIELEGKMTDVDQELSALEDSLGGGASDKDAQAIEAIAMAAKKAQEAVAEFEVPPQETPAQQTKRWTKYAKEHLKGRKIKDVRYMTPSEVSDLDWSCRALIIELDNGTLLYPSSDDEGNDAGSLFGNTDGRNTSGIPDNLTFPVLWR